MIRFPFLGYSYPYHYYPHYVPPRPTSQMTNESSKAEISTSEKIKTAPNNRNAPSKNNPITFHFDGFSDPNQVILEILGIQLYLDDLIILGLLFILYQEEVKDDMLFICLILLLLS